MSITSLISPSGEPTVQDNLWHIALSDNSGQTDFKYVFDLFNGNNQLIRVKVFPDPTNGRGYFDAGPIIRNEITYDWFQPENSFDITFLPSPNVSGEIAVTYNVRVGEDYSGITTLNMASGNVTAYNWSPSLFSRRTDSTTKNNKFFTNRPNIIKGGVTDKILIPYKSAANTNINLWIKVNDNGSYVYTTSSIACNKYRQLSVGIDVMQEYFNWTTIFGSNYENLNYYDVKVYNNATSSYNDPIRIYKDCNSKYETINLHFMNAWGMFDTARFNLVSRLTMDVERKSFSKPDYRFGTSSVTYFDEYKMYNESKINYGSKANWSYKLTMDFPSDEEYQWLSELIVSPQIYAFIEGSYYPVTIKATNYEYSKHINNGLRPLEIDIEMNQIRYGYRR